MPGFFAGGPGGLGSITKKTGGIVEAWYEAFNREDFDALLSFFPDELYQKVSREQMRGIFASYRAKLGGIKSYKIHFAKETHPGGVDTYVLQFSAQYEKADSHDTFNIVRKTANEPCKIAKVEFDSPVLKP
jgi:hypothetical protein